MDPAARKAIGSAAVSWAFAQVGGVAADWALWRHLDKIKLA